MQVQNITKFDDLPNRQRNRLLRRMVEVTKKLPDFKTVPLRTFTALVREGSGKDFNRRVVRGAVFKVEETYLKRHGLESTFDHDNVILEAFRHE